MENIVYHFLKATVAVFRGKVDGNYKQKCTLPRKFPPLRSKPFFQKEISDIPTIIFSGGHFR